MGIAFNFASFVRNHVQKTEMAWACGIIRNGIALGERGYAARFAMRNGMRSAPTDPAALTFLTMTMKPSFRAEFKAGEGGKTAVYMARWVNTRGEKGPWSEITMATVAA